MTDAIEKIIEIKAPVNRVWRALTDANEFGRWFGVELDQPFAAGSTSTGRFTHKGGEHLRWSAEIDRIEPMTLFSYFWRPYALDPNVDYTTEEPTLVAFRLEPTSEGTRITVTETGFDKVPAYRREDALRMNTRGWEMQAERIKAYVEG